MNFAWNVRLRRSIQGSFTCRKSTTRDRRLYFPSEGRCAEGFFRPEKSDGFEPSNLGTKGQHATSRPPKPLCSVKLVDVCSVKLADVCSVKLIDLCSAKLDTGFQVIWAQGVNIAVSPTGLTWLILMGVSKVNRATSKLHFTKLEKWGIFGWASL
jgi:hypothetical protein